MEDGHKESENTQKECPCEDNLNFRLYPPTPGERSKIISGIREDISNEEASQLSDNKIKELISEVTYSELLRSICGSTDDSQLVEQYDGTLGVSKTFVDDHQRSVGQLQWNDDLESIYTDPGDVAGVRWCTGTLITEDLFLTAGHCFDSISRDPDNWQLPLINGTSNIISPAEIATNMHANFNFQEDHNGSLREEEEFGIIELVEYRQDNLDYAIVRLDGKPGSEFGIADISNNDAKVGEMLGIIGHPAGRTKRIEAGPATSLTGDWIRYNDIDTLGGNSGSGILHAERGVVIGVHTHGGCTPDSPSPTGGENQGLRIERLMEVSPILSDLVNDDFSNLISSEITENAQQEIIFELKIRIPGNVSTSSTGNIINYSINKEDS